VKCGSANANRKFAEYAQKYAQLKAEVQGLVAQLRTGS
jgi:multidrug resistance efflux pump